MTGHLFAFALGYAVGFGTFVVAAALLRWGASS